MKNRKVHDAPVGLAEKVAFLRRPDSYPHCPTEVEPVETHMAWVFLAGSEVYKLKKPVRYDVIDFATLEARKRDCEDEVRLNRRLSPEVYRGVAVLRRTAEGELELGRPAGNGEVVEWLVHMRRLPRDRMLDTLIGSGQEVSTSEIRALMELLLGFYERAERIPVAPDDYVRRFQREIGRSRADLQRAGAELPPDRPGAVARGLLRFLEERPELFHARARGGLIVEGHGDLRPEHVCLEPEPVVIDCLEFDRDLRTVDPADDVSFLAVECVRLGAAPLGDRILRAYVELSGDRPTRPLLAFYQSFRSYVRAKVAIWHLSDDTITDHAEWTARTRSHLDLALALLPSA